MPIWSQQNSHAVFPSVSLIHNTLPYKVNTDNVHLQVALVHGPLEKVCPHSSTGRADYFGSTVNRAARLLLAAKPGQILAEAPVMDSVLKQWLGQDPGLPLEGPKPKGSGLLESGAFVIPAAHSGAEPAAEAQPKAYKNKSAPNLMLRLDSYAMKDGTAAMQPSGNTAVDPEANSGSSSLSQSASLSPRAAARNWAKPAKPGVHFAPGASQGDAVPALWDRAVPRKSMDGLSYDDTELETLDVTESYCQPFAAEGETAVSNCHMLKFLAQVGRQHARRDSGLVR